MKRRILALLLIMVMSVSFALPVQAAPAETGEAEEIETEDTIVSEKAEAEITNNVYDEEETETEQDTNEEQTNQEQHAIDETEEKSESNPLSVYAADVEPPVVDLNTLKVSCKEATVGNRVTISMKVTDASNIVNVLVHFRRPITGEEEMLSNFKYNPETECYESTKVIDGSTQSGEWTLSRVFVKDEHDNSVTLWSDEYDLSSASFIVYGTEADVEPPVVDLNTLKVSCKEATVGNRVTISMKVTDASNIVNVLVHFRRPITGEEEMLSNFKYNPETECYESTKVIDESTQSGEWTLSRVFVRDEHDNGVTLWSDKYDLSSASFVVYGTEVDVEPPIIDLSTLKVSAKEVAIGDEVTISVKITDDSKIYNTYIVLQRPISGSSEFLTLKYNSQTQYYECKKVVDNNTQNGLWMIAAISAKDEYENSAYLINSANDFTAAEFTVYENRELIGAGALSNITVISKNTTISNRTIEGDVYIGPDAYVTMNYVTITGKLYVMGVLRANSITAQELHALRVLRGSVSNYMGTVMLFGYANIPYTLITSEVVEEIPYKIQENPVRVIDGKLTIKGAALDFANIMINGNVPTYSESGKFLYEQDWDDGNEVILTFTVPYYDVKRTVTIPVVEMATAEDGSIQFKPVIETEEVTLQLNQAYDLSKLIKVSDEEDGDLSGAVNVVEDNIDITTPGTYFATVSVTDSAGATTEKKITVKVVSKLQSISLNKEKLTLDRGKSEGLKISYLPENTTDSRSACWNSSDESVATVSDDGTVKAVGAGTAVITAEVNGKKATCEVTVYVSLQAIALNKTEAVIMKGMEETLSVSYLPEDTTEPKEVVWESSDEDIVTVDQNGKITAIAGGEAKITAVVGTKKAFCEVTVKVPLESIALDRESITLEKGTAETLKITYNPEDTTEDKTVAWSTADEAVATVDETGKITAVGGGETDITATVGKMTAVCHVSVKVDLVSISLNKDKVTLNKGEEEILTVDYTPEDTTSSKAVNWSSSEESIVTVDKNGKMKAIAAGRAIITAVVGEKRAVCEVTVKVPLDAIVLNKEELILERNAEETLQVDFRPLDTTADRTVAWRSSDESIATVDGFGKIKAIKVGETVITAEVDGKTAVCKVKVISIPFMVKGIVTDLEGPQKAGANIKVSADVSGDKEGVKYKFVWHKNNWEKWDVLQQMSEKDSALWNPMEPGNYTLIIDIEEADGRTTSVQKSYIITENPWTVKGLVTDVESPQKPDASVTLGVEVEGGAGLKYKFVWQKNNWKQWDVIQPMSEKKSAVWVPTTAGEYTLIVDVQDISGKIVSVERKFVVRENPWKARGIKANLPSPQKTGTGISLSADVEGGKGLKYKFVWQKNNWKDWGVLQEMSEKDSAVWTPKEGGVYTLIIDVEDQSGYRESVQRTFSIKEREWSFEGIALSSNALLTGEGLTANVEQSGDIEGLEYKFVWEKDNWKDWAVIQNFSGNSKVQWTPKEAGSYTLYVDIRDLAGRIQTKTIKYVVDDIVIETKDISLGQKMEIHCKTKKDGQLYKFVWEKDGWKSWDVIQGLGTNSNASWMPKETGNYVLYVDVKDSDSGKQVTKTAEVIVKPREWNFNGIKIPTKVKTGESFTAELDATGETAGQQYKYVWEKDNWKDWGVMKELDGQPAVDWKFQEKGTYTIYLDVKELDGSQTTKTQTIIVE